MQGLVAPNQVPKCCLRQTFAVVEAGLALLSFTDFLEVRVSVEI